ncbi:DUF2090 domain-containing protein [Patescibacteria group bacterium]|nr:DUF2090 domain-containing protein [Patescibacteria group bacterium]MBU1922490.1 DUF2090 domain-containing protein [Patescibacteria group bacterium]
MLGYDKPLFILPLDHRSTFIKKLLGLKAPLTREQTRKVIFLKGMIFQAFKRVRAKDARPDQLGILIDEQFGKNIIREAKTKKIIFANSVERSGQKVFTFEYGSDFGKHLKKNRPTMAKVLVRYNPKNKKQNKIQLARLKKLNNFCKKNNIKFLFELLLMPTDQEAKKNKKDFDTKIRPRLVPQAIAQIQAAGIEPDIWKLEAVGKPIFWKKIISQARKGAQRKNVGIIVLGRGGSKTQVNAWLALAARFPQIIGFAVGRTVFFKSLQGYLNKKISQTQAINQIAENYGQLIKNWRKKTS